MGTHESHRVRRVGLYRRYSTEEQRARSFSAEMQEDECLKRLRERHGDAPLAITFYDDFGISGAVGVRDPSNPRAGYRPGLTKLIEDIADGEIDEVVVYAQDRLARVEYLWHFLSDMVFGKYGVPLVFAREHHDIATDEGQMLSSIHAMVAALERRKISKNVSAAVRRRVAEGYHNGPVPYGWQPDPDQVMGPRVRRRIVRNEAEGAVLVGMLTKCMSGWSTAGIVRDLQERDVPYGDRPPSRWTTAAVDCVLSSPVHCGLVRYKDQLFTGVHADQAYWSPQDRERLLQKRRERACRSERRDHSESFPLCRVVFCGHCGRGLSGSRNIKTGTRVYHCLASIHAGSTADDPNVRRCPGVAKEADELERVVLSAVRQLAQSPAVQAAAEAELDLAMRERQEQLSLELGGLRRDRQRHGDGLARLLQMLEAGRLTDDEFDQENRRRRELQESLEAHIAQLENELSQRELRQVELRQAVEHLRSFDVLWDTLCVGERREFLLQIDPHMTVSASGTDLVLQITPGFVDPVTIVMPKRRTNKPGGRDPQDLTPRLLAVLALWRTGVAYAGIAEEWDIALGTVQVYAKEIRARLKVKTLDEAVEMMSDRLDACEPSLPLTGRARRRTNEDPDLLTAPLLRVLEAMAEGLGCLKIAEKLGKDKSTISRQMTCVFSRLRVTNAREAVRRGRKLGLVR